MAGSSTHHQRPHNRPANRLAGESSPYLLQHAYNPVEWWPWGPEAFAAARNADKPIFLSIGYSTCYWCHVMERECFESESIAQLMNELFICIKVDREQRPDVDDIYMTGVQLMIGSGGWPMSMFLEPTTLKPFYGGTYFPPEDRYGRPGFPSLLRGVADAWRNQRAAVIEQATRVADAIVERHAIDSQPVTLDRSHVDLAVRGLMSVYDPVDGGFGGGGQSGGVGPKFPQPANLDMLMEVAWDRPDAKTAVLHTLNRMATGGMYDQIGGGFHRYSVDGQWRVPHFEKMLYDNAQLASTYARAFELTGDDYYAVIVRESLEYVVREMASAEGAFFSAQDAEVNALEGGNYVWTTDQIRDALETEGADRTLIEFSLRAFGVHQGPNFRDPHHPESGEVNILFLPQRPELLAKAMGMDTDDFALRLSNVKAMLLKARSQRDQPMTDDKIIAGWNGLMIAAFADGGRVLKRGEFIAMASKAAGFIVESMSSPDGGLMRIHREGMAQIVAFLEDYAFVIKGLLSLHRASGESRWLTESVRLADVARARFWDETHGGWFDTRDGQSDLFVRIKSVHDGAVPAGNSVMLLNMLDLHEITGEARWMNDARRALEGLSSAIAQHPAGCVLSMIALHRIGATGALRVKRTDGDDVVKVSIEPESIDWHATSKHEIRVRLNVRDGWHINAADAASAGVVPLRIELVGDDGLRSTPRYPRGTPMPSATWTGNNPPLVLSGEVVVPIEIERVGGSVSKPRLLVEYQACDDLSCRLPSRVMLDLTER